MSHKVFRLDEVQIKTLKESIRFLDCQLTTQLFFLFVCFTQMLNLIREI